MWAKAFGANVLASSASARGGVELVLAPTWKVEAPAKRVALGILGRESLCLGAFAGLLLALALALVVDRSLLHLLGEAIPHIESWPVVCSRRELDAPRLRAVWKRHQQEHDLRLVHGEREGQVHRP